MRVDRDPYKSWLFLLRQPPVSLKDQPFMAEMHTDAPLGTHTHTHILSHTNGGGGGVINLSE